MSCAQLGVFQNIHGPNRIYISDLGNIKRFILRKCTCNMRIVALAAWSPLYCAHNVSISHKIITRIRLSGRRDQFICDLIWNKWDPYNISIYLIEKSSGQWTRLFLLLLRILYIYSIGPFCVYDGDFLLLFFDWMCSMAPSKRPCLETRHKSYIPYLICVPVCVQKRSDGCIYI